MNFFDFVTQEELESLPDDPAMAFASFLRIALGRLREEVARYNANEQEQWHMIEQARVDFMNVALAAAKSYEIAPFADMEVPRAKNFDHDTYQQFQYDLDHYVAQLAIGGAARGKRETVDIPAKSKDRIRSHLGALRECIEKSDLPERRRGKLLDKVDALNEELEKRRVNLLKATGVVIAVLGTPGSLWGSAEVANKLASNIMQIVSEAKVAEDEERMLAPAEPLKAISPPRTAEDRTARITKGYDRGLGDEIPL
jgi:hypothetical protein